jgi:hypothetical protein
VLRGLLPHQDALKKNSAKGPSKLTQVVAIMTFVWERPVQIKYPELVFA